MKLLFSEAQPDYSNYIFPYVVWGFPEPGETPESFFAAGFLPSSKNLDRFYLARQVRVPLAGFSPSSENRRILRKGEGIRGRLLPRQEFEYTTERREFCKCYAEARLASGNFSDERLEAIFGSLLVSHVMVFNEEASGREVGFVALYMGGSAALYYMSFYDPEGISRNLGMFMMTSAVKQFAEAGLTHLYLGTCYSKAALYKTQFNGCEFFNGCQWSDDIAELKFLIERQDAAPKQHLLEEPEFRERVPDFAARSFFQVAAPGN